MGIFKDDKLYSPVEIADVLAVRKETVYDWIKSKKLKAYRIGKRWKIQGKDINNFIKVNK